MSAPPISTSKREADDLPQTVPPNGKPRGTKRKKAPQVSAITSAAVGTDVSAGRRLVAAHGSDLRYCHPWKKWLVWDGCRWKIDDTGEVERHGKGVIDSLWLAVPTIAEGERPAFIKMVQDRSRRERLAAMIALAASEPGIPVLPGDLDKNPWLLNCPNGTLELRTGELRQHRREDMLSKVTAARFNPDTGSYQWDQFIEGIFAGNLELMEFVQRFCGYSLTGDVREHVLPVFYGTGANGKTTFIEAIMSALGADYATKATPDLLLLKRGETHPTERASLQGKRFVAAVETAEGRKLDETLAKELTGGDTVTARRMREDFWEFRPTCKIVLATNNKPIVQGTDNGIWRRLRLVPFNVRFEGDKQDKGLGAKLQAERDGILAWAVRGCLDWQRQGLGEPESVRAATADYRSDSDVLGRFVANACLTGSPVYKVRFSHFYDALKQWCEAGGDDLPSKKAVGQWLQREGCCELRSNGRWYSGIALRETDVERSNDGTHF